MNTTHLVYDLFPRNVLRNQQGNLFFVDAEFKALNQLEPAELRVRDLEAIWHSNENDDIPINEVLSKNSVAVREYYKEVLQRSIDWEREVKHQNHNAQD